MYAADENDVVPFLAGATVAGLWFAGWQDGTLSARMDTAEVDHVRVAKLIRQWYGHGSSLVAVALGVAADASLPESLRETAAEYRNALVALQYLVAGVHEQKIVLPKYAVAGQSMPMVLPGNERLPSGKTTWTPCLMDNTEATLSPLALCRETLWTGGRHTSHDLRWHTWFDLWSAARNDVYPYLDGEYTVEDKKALLYEDTNLDSYELYETDDPFAPMALSVYLTSA